MKTVGPFTLLSKLAIGGTSQVYLGTSETYNELAIKVLDKAQNESVRRRICREMQLLRKVTHDFIVKLQKIVETPNAVYIAFEYCSGGDLKHYIKRNGPVPEDKARVWLHQVLCGLVALQDQDIMHRDVKTANILLSTDDDLAVAKLGDLGFARVIEEANISMTHLGTPCYFSPELVNGEIYDFKSDVWSLGVVAYEMLVGRLPFDAVCTQVLKRQQQQQQDYPPTLSPAALNFLQTTLTYNPNDRPSFYELLSHEFFDGLDSPFDLLSPLPLYPSLDKVLEQETEPLDDRRIVLEEALNEVESYKRQCKLAGLALLHVIIIEFRDLRSRVENLRERVGDDLVESNHKFADLHYIVHRTFVTEEDNFSELAKRNGLPMPLSLAAETELSQALSVALNKQAKRVQNDSEKLKLVHKIALLAKEVFASFEFQDLL